MEFMCVQITKHKARLLAWRSAFLFRYFLTVVSGALEDRPGTLELYKLFGFTPGTFNFGIFLVGISFQLLLLTSSSPVHHHRVPKFFSGSTEWNILFFKPQFSNGAIYWPLEKPHSWITIIPINWFFFLLRKEKCFARRIKRYLSWLLEVQKKCSMKKYYWKKC